MQPELADELQPGDFVLIENGGASPELEGVLVRILIGMEHQHGQLTVVTVNPHSCGLPIKEPLPRKNIIEDDIGRSWFFMFPKHFANWFIRDGKKITLRV